ncbi:type I restriction enzyme [Caudoviricetes sp.]|nr:type I restriction enzyme [Caudoviricetes sp.]
MTDAVKRALDMVSGYQDPVSPKMKDWAWRPLKDVREELGGLHEIPSHVEKFGEFMDETARRAVKGGLTPRDLIKAYAITRSSIQRRAQTADKVRAAGLDLPPDMTGQIRPEGAMGEWLHSPMGQRYLDQAELGKVDEEAVANAQQVMKPFGLNAEMDALPWAVLHLGPRHKEVSDLVARALKKHSSPEEWRNFSKDLRGIGTAKAGFVASMLGRGDQPTLDARQVILQTGMPTSEAKKPLAKAGYEAVDRLAARQSALNPKMDPELEPFRQHLTHHAIWDKAGNEETTHDDVMRAMRGAKDGGRIGYKDGGSIEDHPLARALAAIGLPGMNASREDIQGAIGRINSPFSDDPSKVLQALNIAKGLKTKTAGETGTGSYYNIKQPVSPADVKAKISDIPGVQPVEKNPMSWEDAYQKIKGGTLINVGGDRSNLGRLTHINGKKLNWPVDLHAGPKYMLEPNKGAIWANSASHTTAFNKKIREAAKKGPVYGVYAPMGPQSVDSSHNMFDTVMAQIDKDAIHKDDAAEFDAALRAGLHMEPKERQKGVAAMEGWPGILNAKEASEFARNLPGVHRSGVVNFMDKSYWRDRGFPHVGVTRAAITDPEVRDAPGNMLGHRIVQFDPDKLRGEETAFKHSTYTDPSAGEYVADVPLVQRHYAMPDVVENLLGKPTKGGHVVHPYSPDALGRATFRKLTEEQKQLQPVNERMIESIGRGLERQKRYGFNTGGAVVAEPTEAQKEAGNYKKHHISFQGLPVSIENPKGSIRKGPGWQVRVPYDYGYIKRTEGADGDHVDVCIGPDAESDHVFIVDQQDHKTGAFDEHKVMLGYRTREEATRAYQAGFSDGKGPERQRAVVRMSMKEFKSWLKSCDTKKPVRSQGHIDRALSLTSRYTARHDRDAG